MARGKKPTGKMVKLSLLAVSILVSAGSAPSASADLSETARSTISTSGTVITVTTTADELNSDGDCSLREAIQASNTNTAVDACSSGSGDDTIVLAADSYTLSIEGRGEDGNTQGDLDITGVLTITGTGATTTIIQAGTDTFTGIDRVFDVLGSGDLTVQNVQIRHGYANFGGIPHINGGGIYVAENGLLDIENCMVTNNWGANAGGIYSSQGATVNVVNCIISNNESYSVGGGLLSAGTAKVRNTTFRGNKAIFGGALCIPVGVADIGNCTFAENISLEMDPGYGSDGGAIANSGSLVITSTTFYSNTATNHIAVPPLPDVQAQETSEIEASNRATANDTVGGGAISNRTNGTVLIVNSTFSDNSAYATKEGGAILNSGTITITNGTFSDNVANDSGTLANYGTLTLTNTIVANSNGELNCSGLVIINGGHNIDSGTTCGWDEGNGSMSSIDPQFRELALNEPGTTETLALPLSSPAIDAGDSAYCPAMDQRGVSRPYDGNGDGSAICDIGAYECIPLFVHLPVVLK